MKHKLLFLLVGIAVIGAGCSSNTYSNLRNKEDKLIANYISRNGLRILNELPENDQWGEKDYYKVAGYDNLYFHLISRGDSVRYDSISPTKTDTVDLSIVLNDVIVTRYKQFMLTENADTLSYWTTLDQTDPYKFRYLNYADCEATGWHIAVLLMEYPNSQCEIIVPSKLGFADAQQTVTPLVYIMKINVKP